MDTFEYDKITKEELINSILKKIQNLSEEQLLNFNCYLTCELYKMENQNDQINSLLGNEKEKNDNNKIIELLNQLIIMVSNNKNKNENQIKKHKKKRKNSDSSNISSFNYFTISSDYESKEKKLKKEYKKNEKILKMLKENISKRKRRKNKENVEKNKENIEKNKEKNNLEFEHNEKNESEYLIGAEGENLFVKKLNNIN